MKKIIKAIVISSLVMVVSSFTSNSTDNKFSLSVEVRDLENSKGVVQFALYNKEGSIPDQHYEKYYRLDTSEIIDGVSSIIFEGLPKGTYAVNILHDENKNGKIDKGFVLPKEGLGFSNYQSISPINRPNYSKASFELSADLRIEIKVIYL